MKQFWKTYVVFDANSNKWKEANNVRIIEVLFSK